MRGLIVALATCLLLLVLPRAAWAEIRTVTIDLEVDNGERPTYVCILHKDPTDDVKPGGSVFEALSPNRKLASVVADNESPELKQVWWGRTADSPKVVEWLKQRIESKAGAAPNPVAPTSEEIAAKNNIEVALDALARTSTSRDDVCGAGTAAPTTGKPSFEERSRLEKLNACAPRFSVARRAKGHEKYLRCAPNSVSVPAPPRVLVLDASFDAATTWWQLNLVSLVGNVVTLRFNNDPKAKESRDELSVVVAGGHYVEGVSRTADRGRVSLQLVPRCHTREVRAPDPLPTAKDRHLKITVCTPNRRVTCRRQVDQSVTLMIPDAPAGARSRLKLAIADEPIFDDDEYEDEPCRDHTPPNAIGAFETQWTSRAPPSELVVKPVAFQVHWRVPCSYPYGAERECPAARLKDHGLACGPGSWSTRDGTCSYTCPGTNAGVLSFPANVVLSKGELSWTTTVHHAGETLEDTSRDERQYYLDLSSWGGEADIERLRRRRYDQVPEIEIDVPGGATHRFRPKTGLIALPGAACDALLRYRFVGDRAYVDRDVAIEKGRVTLEPPEKSGRLFTVSVALGGGALIPSLAHPFTKDDDETYGKGVVTPRIYGGVNISLRWRYRAAGWVSTEMRFGYLFAEQPYGPLHTQENNRSREIPTTEYSRYVLSIRPVFTPFRLADRELDIVPDAAALGIGRPLFERDSTNVGETLVFWSPSLALRWHVVRWGFFELGARFIYPERYFSYDTDFRGTPVRTQTTLGQTLIDLSIGATIL